MKMTTRFGLPLAAALGVALAGPASAAFAQGSGPTTYTANLAPVPLNGANSATGTLTLVLNGSQATITEHVSGLAATFMGAPYPHVQHIHGGAHGVCPTASADTNGDKVISTTEGQPSYGRSRPRCRSVVTPARRRGPTSRSPPAGPASPTAGRSPWTRRRWHR